ncbi:MAG: ComEC/Rec2 family competence protein [Rikenellaceae bacterium]
MENLHAPILKILLPFALGIALQGHYAQPLLYSISLLITLLLIYLVRPKSLFLYLATLLVGYTSAGIARGSAPLEERENVIITVQFNEGSDAKIIAMQDANGRERQCRHRVIASTLDVDNHCIATVRANIKPFESDASDYHRAMRRRGYRVSVRVAEVLSTSEQCKPLGMRLNEWAFERLNRLPLTRSSAATAAAMALARREGLPKEITESYSRSGTSHIMALSGLHLGVIVVLISAVTCLLSLLHRGYLVANVFSIATIWLFALMAGAGESLIRASLMFTIAQLASLIARRNFSLNSLLLSALAILCVDPLALYDLGLQLSFIAVAAILMVGVPVSQTIATPKAALNLLLSSITIGLAATVATIPLLSYTFGHFSLIAPLATLPLLLSLSLIIYISILWILFPIGFLAPIVGYVLELIVTVQNYMVTLFAESNYGYISFKISSLGLVVSYAILIVVAVLISKWAAKQNREKEDKILSYT